MNAPSAQVAGRRPAAKGRGLRVAATVVLGAVLSGAAGGCATSAVYVSSTAQGMFFKLPAGWHVFSQGELKRDGFVLDVNATSQANQVALGNSYPIFYSLSSPSPEVASRIGIHYSSQLPWALAVVISLGFNSTPSITLSQLDDQFFNVDGLSQAGGKATALMPPTELVKGQFRGMRIAYRVDQPSGPPFSFEQVAMLNGGTTKLWMLDIGCSPGCFAHQRRAIDAVASSFTLRAVHQ